MGTVCNKPPELQPTKMSCGTPRQPSLVGTLMVSTHLVLMEPMSTVLTVPLICNLWSPQLTMVRSTSSETHVVWDPCQRSTLVTLSTSSELSSTQSKRMFTQLVDKTKLLFIGIYIDQIV